MVLSSLARTTIHGNMKRNGVPIKYTHQTKHINHVLRLHNVFIRINLIHLPTNVHSENILPMGTLKSVIELFTRMLHMTRMIYHVFFSIEHLFITRVLKHFILEYI